jgi:outer membrane protein insertion porin family
VFVLAGAAAVLAVWSAWPLRARAGSPDVLYEARRVERIRRLGPLVESVEFAGNDSYSAGELLDYMKTKPSGFLRGRHYSRRTLEGDVANLERLYASRGFLEAAAAVEDLLVSPDGLSVEVLVGVREGRRWTISGVTIEGNSVLDEGALRSLLKAVTGRPLAADEVEADRQALLAEYARRSFLDARVGQVVERDDASATAALRYTIVEGPESSIGRIIVSGTEKTRGFVLDREFRFEEGEPFDPAAIGETQAALYRTGLFNTVVIEPAPEDTGLAVKRLLVRVRERASGRFDFTAGYATLDGYEVGAEVSDRNVQGQATTAGLEGRLSEFARDARATVGDPWFLGLPVAASAEVRYGWEDQETFTAETAAGEVSLSKLIGRAVTLRGGYAFERTLVLETSEEEGDLGANYTSDLLLGLTFDTRDDILNTRRGVLARAQVDIASSRFGGTNDFVRTGLSLRGFARLRRGTVLAGAVEVGWIEPGASPGDVPVNERYFAGGEASVRGFERNSLAPAAEGGEAEGGLGLLVARLEARVPVWKGLSVVGFADAGRAFAVPDNISVGGLAAGAGGGLRYDTRVGVLRFDLATPVSERGAPKAYFSVGQAF